MATQIVLSVGAGAEEEAAAVAAVLAVLQAENAQTPGADIAAEPSGWRSAARLETQGMRPARLPARPSWGRIERLRRANRGGSGIVGG